MAIAKRIGLLVVSLVLAGACGGSGGPSGFTVDSGGGGGGMDAGGVDGGGTGGDDSFWMHDARSKKKNANIASSSWSGFVHVSG